VAIEPQVVNDSLIFFKHLVPVHEVFQHFVIKVPDVQVAVQTHWRIVDLKALAR